MLDTQYITAFTTDLRADRKDSQYIVIKYVFKEIEKKMIGRFPKLEEKNQSNIANINKLVFLKTLLPEAQQAFCWSHPM